MMCETCGVVHDEITWRSLGMLCGRCRQHTGNHHQGHYWGLCKVLLDRGIPWKQAMRKLHFCCPGDCELEAKQDTRECGCPVNVAGDIRCHICNEYVNVRCWNCKTPRGEGPCPSSATGVPIGAPEQLDNNPTDKEDSTT